MNYQNTVTDEILTHKQIKALTPNVSYPKDGADMLGDEWKLLSEGTPPAYDQNTQELSESPPVNFVKQWEVVTLSKDKKDKKDKDNSGIAWLEYKAAKEASEKQAWIDAGSPKFA